MEKVKIESYTDSSEMPYMHLIPLVQALITTGNTPVHKDIFYKDRDGWRCDLKKKINFNFIRKEFDLPDTIYLSEENDSILCKETWIEIKGSCKFDLC